MIEALKLGLAFYLLLLAVAAAWGQHRELLLLPGRVVFSLVSLLLWLVTLGRNGSLPLRLGAKRRGRRVWRGFRSLFRDFSETESGLSGEWVSGDKSTERDDALG